MSEKIQEGQQTPQVSGLGLELKRGREAKGYTIERIADELHLRPSIVTAMEEENYELLPGDIFLKGYIRSYARLVGLSEHEIVKLLDQHLSREADLEAHTKHVKGREKRKKHSKYALFLLVIAVVSGIVFYFWSEKLGNGKADLFQIESEPESPLTETVDTKDIVDNGEKILVPNGNTSEPPSFSETSQSPVAEPGDDKGEPQVLSEGDVVTPAIEVESGTVLESSTVLESTTIEAGRTTEGDGELASDEPLEPEIVNSGLEQLEDKQGSTLVDEPATSEPVTAAPIEDIVVVDEATAVNEAEPEVVDSAQSVLSETPLEQGSIKVVFSGDCWFTLKNGEGKTVIADLKKAGDEINYSGSLPFSVVVGAVSEVTMHFDDTLIDFSTVRVRNNRASLELTH